MLPCIIESKNHGTRKTVVFGHNPGQGRQAFFAAVLVIGGDEHNIFAQTGALGTFVYYPIISRIAWTVRLGAGRDAQQTEQANGE